MAYLTYLNKKYDGRIDVFLQNVTDSKEATIF